MYAVHMCFHSRFDKYLDSLRLHWTLNILVEQYLQEHFTLTMSMIGWTRFTGIFHTEQFKHAIGWKKCRGTFYIVQFKHVTGWLNKIYKNFFHQIRDEIELKKPPI